MRIVISGGSGLVGSHLIPLLQAAGHSVVNLTTNHDRGGTWSNGVHHVFWAPWKGIIPREEIEGCDAVINLAGYPIAVNWTEENKSRIIASRLDATNLLVSTILSCEHKPHTFISASASGYYVPSADQWLDEQAPNGKDFLAELCWHWEDCSRPLEEAGIRRVLLRTGIVLDRKEGAMARMLPFFLRGAGAPVGSGQQYVSWVHVDDLARMFVFAMENEHIRGAVNAAGPLPVTNKEFSHTLARLAGKRIILPNVPRFAIRILFGEMGTVLLDSHRLATDKIRLAGFTWKFPTLAEALTDILKR